MLQTALVIIIIAAAIAYVARKYRPSRLKSENPCDSCAGCAAGPGAEFVTRPGDSGKDFASRAPGSCCDNRHEPENCPHSGEPKEVSSNKDIP
jgi:hypothetical protein